MKKPSKIKILRVMRGLTQAESAAMNYSLQHPNVADGDDGRVITAVDNC